MQARENPVRDKARREAKDRLGVLSILLQLRYDAGWPDVLFLIPGGCPLLMEFKRVGEDLKPLQAYKKATLRKLDYDCVGPIDSVAEAIALIKDRLKQAATRKLAGGT